LGFLKDRDVRIALATSTGRERALQRHSDVGILDFFDEKVCGDEIVKGKPDPDIYIRACEKLGVSPAEAVAVE
ncbi:HAD family hydrolase, partial [Coprococcus eutactus]|uniref:HAD family hydrolase n=1 Tax=Coprococcus eutactus TaxID=33043 RepID=UPI00210ACA0B